jgi:alpha,alpha-trehalase
MSTWKHRYDGFEAEQQGLREALLTLGNGYFATRGAAEEAEADGTHYPGTYLAGGYNRAETELQGRVVENEDLVNFPNWLPLNFCVEDGDWFSLNDVDILDYRQELDMKRGVMDRELRFRDRQGRESTLWSRRLVHMGNKNLAAIEWRLRPENWSGRLTVRSALDGRVVNAGVERYRKLEGRHLEPLESGEVGEDGIYLLVQTRQSRIQVAQAARTQVFLDDKPLVVERQKVVEPDYVAELVSLEVPQGATLGVEKVVALYSSRDRAVSEAGLEARQAIARAEGFERLLETHVRAWRHLWRRCDIVLNGHNHERTQCILRFHLFHLLQTVSFNTIDLDVGVPARGWHGEAYRGHIFWDELFIFPYLTFRIPELTRALLRYRHRRLDAARHAAREAGFAGALYPWQSGSNGREETQKLHLNPKSGRWLPDNSHLQYHVNAAIAYNVWQYYKVTHDFEFLSFYGAEMILEIARFWTSIASYNQKLGRYEILKVMGPDEFHDAMPGAAEPGLDNNTYTNVMAVWVLTCALRVLERLGEDRRKELRETLELSSEEIARWEEISRKMRVVFHEDGVLSQFEGYEDLDELDWEGYRQRYGDIHRLDRILEAEGDSPNRYKASKQADQLMLFYLFSAEELFEIFERLGYPFDPTIIPKTIDYCLQRSSHGSTLSRVAHAWVLARSDRARSWRLFNEALESDVSDVQRGATREGIHLGAMAGTVDLVQRCYLGLEVREDAVWMSPVLPEEMRHLELRLRYRGRWLDVAIDDGRLKVSARRDWAAEVEVGVKDELYLLKPGESIEVAL